MSWAQAQSTNLPASTAHHIFQFLKTIVLFAPCSIALGGITILHAFVKSPRVLYRTGVAVDEEASLDRGGYACRSLSRLDERDDIGDELGVPSFGGESVDEEEEGRSGGLHICMVFS